MENPGFYADAHLAGNVADHPAHILLWMCDAKGACEFVSPSWLAFTGRNMLSQTGAGWIDCVHPEDREAVLRGLQAAIAGQQPFRLVYRYLRADGDYRWFVNHGMLRITPAGEFAGYIGQCFDVSERQGPPEIALSTQHMIELLRQTRLIAVVLDPEGQVLFSNGGLERLLRCDAAELMNSRLFERYLDPEDSELLALLYPNGAPTAQFPPEFESALITHRGDTRYVLWRTVAPQKCSSLVSGIILIGDDVTAARSVEEQLKLAARLFDGSNQAMLITDAEARIIAVNYAFTQLTGYAKEEVVGQNPRIMQSGRHDAAFYQQMWATIKQEGHWRGDVWDRHKSGRLYPKFLSISALKNERGQITNYAGIFYEISERKAFEEKLDFLAHYDMLTGLPNRCLLLDRLKLATELVAREGVRMGVLYLDLDGFKSINDTLGHDAGDALLKMAAQRMKGCVRAVDTVARIGGDEFVIIVPDIRHIEDVAGIARKVLAALSQPYELNGAPVIAKPSIGISVYPDDHIDGAVLLKHADAAMYEVKQTRRGGFHFFHDLGNRSGAGCADAVSD